ncbi:MAG: transposase [Elusimicrobiota bacterium]
MLIMGRKPRILYPGAIYHAIARGNARQRLFFIPEDWDYFMDSLARLKRTAGFRLFAYCLMPNHIHLLIQALAAALPDIVGPLLSRYARYINKRRRRSGHVFQDRFRSPLCRDEAHLMRLTRYIHLNPVRANLINDPADWKYSSYREYLGADTMGLVETEPVLKLLSPDLSTARNEFTRFMYAPDSLMLAAAHDNISNGRNGLIPPHLEIADRNKPLLEDLAADWASTSGLSLDILRSGSRIRSICGARRDFILKACVQGYPLREIASYLGVSSSAASQAANKIT